MDFGDFRREDNMNCVNYYVCKKTAQQCSLSCEWYNKTCWDCSIRVGEECDIDGHEVCSDSIPCDNFNLNH